MRWKARQVAQIVISAELACFGLTSSWAEEIGIEVKDAFADLAIRQSVQNALTLCNPKFAWADSNIDGSWLGTAEHGGLLLPNTIGTFENPMLFFRGNDSQRLEESKVRMSKQLGFWALERHLDRYCPKGDRSAHTAATVDFELFRPILENAVERGSEVQDVGAAEPLWAAARRDEGDGARPDDLAVLLRS